MIGKKINQLATELAPESTDLTIIGDPTTGVSKKITIAQLGAIFSGAVSFYTNLAAFPVTGDINVIYCAKDTQKLYLWSGSAYVEVFPSQALLDTYQLRSEKGNANGYASLDSLGKVPISQLPSSIMEYKGTWNAATNTPTLANGTGDTGDVYICNVAGTVNFGAGPITFAVGDYVIYSGTIWQRSSGAVGTVTSVAASITGNSVSISGSPIVTSGTLAFAFAGNATQYVRGDGQLATLPTNGGGGGASVSYYLNGSINQGTIGGVTYYEMNKTPIIGAGTDFTRNSNGYIASFLTDANDPALLNIPAGNFNFETYFEASSGGGSPTFYIELYKYDGTNFTLIASNSTSPKLINDGTNIEAYFSALAVPQTTLTLTDRLAIRIYVTTAGRTITLHTENGHLCQVITTFTTGLTALNGLTAQVQYLATGTSGTDFNIASASATHTFNLPTASATNRGALSSADWTTFNNKQNALTLTTTGSSGASTLVGATLNIPNYTLAGLGGVPTSRTLTINGTAFDLSANRTWSVGTVTSVGALTIGTTGTDLSSTVANGTTTPVITLNVPTASATNRGALSSTDWTTFNNKQNALTNPITGISASGRVAYFNGDTSITGSSNFFWDSTNNRLGIGLNNPQRTLEIHNATADSQLRISGAAPSVSLGEAITGAIYQAKFGLITANGQYVTGGVAGDFVMISQTGATIFATSSTEKMRVQASGNVSIGNTNDTFRLDVTGTLRATGAVTFSSSVTANNHVVTGGNNLRVLTTTNATTGWQYADFLNTSGRIVWGINGSAANGLATNSLAYGGVLYANNSLQLGVDGDMKMTLNASGNLGLGVTPSAWASGFTALQVKNSSFWSTGNDASIIANAYYDGSNYRYIGTAAASRTYHNTDGSIIWSQAPSGTAGNAISFTQAMTLDASGNLLVGDTTNPYSLGRLVIAHNSSFARTYFQRGVNLIEIIPSNGTLPNQISSSFTASGSAYMPLSLSARQTASDLYLATNGNVGIGTANPFSKFEVYTTLGASVGINHSPDAGTYPRASGIGLGANSTSYTVSSGGSTISFIGGAGMYAENTASSGNPTSLVFWTNLAGTPAERMRITSGGNVGIGMTGYSGTRLTTRGADTSSTNWSFFAENSSGTTVLGARNDGQVFAGAIGTSVGTTLVLDASGYINKLSSSIRYKKDITPIDIGLDFILALKPVSYNLKNGNTAQVGFIAEDFPDNRFVSMSMIDSMDKTKGYQKEGVNYAQIVAPLVKAIQELKQELDTLKNK